MSICQMLIASASSPAQGAMYVPLALKFVYSNRLFSMANLPCLRIPVQQITANPVTTGASPVSHSHTGAIAGGTIGVTALLAIGAALLTRSRSRRRKSSFVKPDESTTVTPFNTTLRHASAPSDLPAPSSRSRVASPPLPPPVGLSSKELARLRQDSSRPQSTDALPFGSLSAATERGVTTSSSEARRLQSQVESLMREMQQLRAERSEAPPGYED